MQELGSKKWLNSVDCGGLVHVSDLMYSLFVELCYAITSIANKHAGIST